MLLFTDCRAMTVCQSWVHWSRSIGGHELLMHQLWATEDSDVELPALVIDYDLTEPLKSSFRISKTRCGLATRIMRELHPHGHASSTEKVYAKTESELDVSDLNSMLTAQAMLEIRDDMVDFCAGACRNAGHGQ